MPAKVNGTDKNQDCMGAEQMAGKAADLIARKGKQQGRTIVHWQSEFSSTAARRVLVVDDNHEAAEALAKIVELLGHEGHVATNGEEAIEAAERFRPQFIFLDIGLPIINGYDVASYIREQPWGRRMNLVALTGYSQEQDRIRSMDSGFDQHIVKPIDLATIRRVLNNI
jgi:CheY-like chemotaxis protein